MSKRPGNAREHSGRLRLKWPWLRRSTHGLGATAILESLDVAVVSRHPDGVISSWNGAAKRLHGYTRSEMIGKTFDTIVPSSSGGWDAIATRASLIAGLSDSYESERVCKGGEQKRVRVQISPVKDASGAIVGVSTVERDIDPVEVDEDGKPAAEAGLQDAGDDAPVTGHSRISGLLASRLA
jgi:PAS domain S-box-containing protein